MTALQQGEGAKWISVLHVGVITIIILSSATPTTRSRLVITRVPSVLRWGRILFSKPMKSAVLVGHGIHNQMLIIGFCINTLTDALESCRIGINLLGDALDGHRVDINVKLHPLEHAHHILKINRRRNNMIWGRGSIESRGDILSMGWVVVKGALRYLWDRGGKISDDNGKVVMGLSGSDFF